MTKAAGSAVTPNLSFVATTRHLLDDLQSVLSDPEARYLHRDVRAMWREQNPTQRQDVDRFDRREQAKYAFLRKLTKALNVAEVPLLLGTDASAPGMFPGRSAHLELRELVAAGLTPFEAIATGTRIAGEFIGEHTSTPIPFGIIAPGYAADLMLVERNPLDDVGNASNIQGVMARGAWLTSAELRAKRDSIAAEHRR
jgi:imidazolonepropionase-like amidohydrolase